MVENKLRELLDDMTFDEKVGQLLQVAGNFFDDESLTTGGLDYFKMTMEERDLCGSILSVSGAEKIKKLQDDCMKKQPHNIPQIFMFDIINGYETIYPVPLGQGASFNVEMAQELAAMAAREGAAAGMHVTFSPMVDLVRDARWGRVMESTGEDAYLNGQMGAAMVRGYQGDDIKEKGHLAACVKHFAGYGGSEAGRDYDVVELSERTLRDDYLPAYEAAVKAGVKLVMTSFNTLNRVPSSGNKWLMRQVLRDEMGFEGMVISDYGAVTEMINHGIARDEKQAAELAIKAGVDMEMMSLCYSHGLKQLVDEGKVDIKLIDESVFRILKLKNELGLFENPYKDASAEDEKNIILCDAHRKLALEAAADSFVLLENEDSVLPLKNEPGKKVAFIGPYVDSKKVYGSWSFPRDEEAIISIKQGVERLAPAEDVTFSEGSLFFGHDIKFKNGETVKYDKELSDKLLEEAVEAAKNADQVVMCIGEYNQQTGEAASQTLIQMPDDEMRLLREVAKVNSNIITLIFTGRPLELEEVKQLSKAVMVVWFPGTETGNAIAQVLWGTKEPGGRIPMSFPYRVGQEPCYYNRYRTGRPNDGTLDRYYVNGYIDQIDKMLYPFGYGKTYTSFKYSDVRVSSEQLKAGNNITASVDITNTGTRKGTETVQLYVADLYGSVIRPVKQLKGFEKVTLEAGEKKTVLFEITEEMFRFYDIDMKYTSEPGDCMVYIGPDSETQNGVKIELV